MPVTTDHLTARTSHLTPRDRDLLDKLGDHKVLSTSHVHHIWFASRRTAEMRLNELRELDMVSKFTFARQGGGVDEHMWTLGVLGHQWQASRDKRAEPTRRAALAMIHQTEASRTLTHLLLVNEFFARLAGHARRHPGASLERWWSDAKSTSAFRGVQPDGHALWSVEGEFAGLFLEADTGTEPLTRVVAKLAAYRRLAANDSASYPVLFWLHSPKREAHLQQQLRAANVQVSVATATHDADPAGPVWLTSGSRDRVPFWQLPSNHGAAVAGNPNFRDGELDLPGRDPFHP
ncbi:hypothetical protein Rhe02_09710 [Rhizocola hellebori]|uniref:Replication-relaxation n=1 Tax=Rhizocola hellebori TaxID=1392758 RepID=A0A8J3VCU3_9ACTN|nr:hypothetical protein Rhe02_09710 [Rhizocola hellebori]